MLCRQELVKVQKANYFTQRQVEILTGFDRWHLVPLKEIELLMPSSKPVLYSWNQVIILRLLFLLRQENWPAVALKKASGISQKIVENIESAQYVAFGAFEEGLEFDFLMPEKDCKNHLTRAVMDAISDKNSIKIKFGGILFFNMQVLIQELKQLGETNIKKFPVKLEFAKRGVTPQYTVDSAELIIR